MLETKQSALSGPFNIIYWLLSVTVELVVLAVEAVLCVWEAEAEALEDTDLEDVEDDEALLEDAETLLLVLEEVPEEARVNIEETLSNILPPWVVHWGI